MKSASRYSRDAEARERRITLQQRNTISYWHVELPEHAMLSAEGVAAESYLDTGNRSAFTNGGSVMDLHPDFSWRVWATQACAPLVLNGPRLVSAKHCLLARANALGNVITDEPGLSVLADGVETVAETNGRSWYMRLPGPTATVRLASRVYIPADVQPDTDDLRPLGVAVAQLQLDGEEVGLDSPAFGAGWHAPEQHWRWTDGNASIAVPDVRELEFKLAISGCYWQDAIRCAVCAA